MKFDYFHTWGPVRGGCHHKHETIEQALECLADDGEGCSMQGGYSDRAPFGITVRYDDGKRVVRAVPVEYDGTPIVREVIS